jgi:hypothetical protein
MALTSTPVQDRRRFGRADAPSRLAVDLLQLERRFAVDAVNVSEAGLCLRLEERLEVRSLVNLQLRPSRGRAGGVRPVRCEGRVAWVIQRLDLREVPPYLFDVGIEFSDPPAFLRRLMAGRGGHPAARPPTIRAVSLASAVLHGRQYVPTLERAANSRASWHLVIAVDGVPCFSERYPSERAAKAAWEAFRRRQARRVAVG